MGLGHNPKIATDGLVLCLDAANQKSYPGSGTVWGDLSGNGNDGDIVNCEIVGYSVDDTKLINVPFRRKSTFKLINCSSILSTLLK
jgi:hypothetical protein